MRYLELCGAGERSGLYYTPVNTHLTVDEVAYILENSESQVLITSTALQEVAAAAMKQVPAVTLGLVLGANAASGVLLDYDETTAAFPSTPIADERLGAAMLYSSGTTGRPKGILRRVPDVAPADAMALSKFLLDQWEYRDGMRYLSPAPLYHSAPQGATGLTIRIGGTVYLMEKFDPEDFLAYVERYRITHCQMVPTMFSRLLKLPAEVRSRYDLSSLEMIVHAAAPCPVPVKEQMIEWWGPIIKATWASSTRTAGCFSPIARRS